MSDMFDLADKFVDEQAKLDPIAATFEGIDGHDDQMTDYSPAGYAQRADSVQKYLTQLSSVDASTERDLLARNVMTERMTLSAESYAAQDYLQDVSFSWSAAQEVRSVFDQMRYESKDDWETACKRLSKVPEALMAIKQTLQESLDRNLPASRRQILACARQARIWAGQEAQPESFFRSIMTQHSGTDSNRKLEEKLGTAADAAAQAFSEYSDFLVDVYAPRATEVDGVGEERYLRNANSYLGMKIDPHETYSWGWEEISRIRSEIDATCAEIKAGATLSEVIELLDNDHERWIYGEDSLVEWLKGLLDRAINGLDGKVFDIPAPLRRLDVRIAPPGGPANQYYVPPSEDLSRAGTYWYPTDGKTKFPLWAEISTAYHEGVPGHHLQCGIVKVMHEELSRFQRNMFVSGHGEGWALYAERLMDEVGFYDRPEYKLDMLLSHYFRAARVVTDIGLHLGYKTPEGDTWTPEFAHRFMKDHCNMSDSFVASEIVRYLGIPGQAISYKVGERVWLEARADARQKQGDAFNLREWHNAMLKLGPMGLDQLKHYATA